jgi:hypothetical protein
MVGYRVDIVIIIDIVLTTSLFILLSLLLMFCYSATTAVAPNQYGVWTQLSPSGYTIIVVIVVNML